MEKATCQFDASYIAPQRAPVLGILTVAKWTVSFSTSSTQLVDIPIDNIAKLQYNSSKKLLSLNLKDHQDSFLFQLSSSENFTEAMSLIQSFRKSVPAPVLDHVIEISVDAPRVEQLDGRSHVLYTVRVKSNISQLVKEAHSATMEDTFRKWSVERRYSEFEFIRNAFVRAGLSPLPPLPPKSVLNATNAEFLAERRSALERFVRTLITNFGEKCCHIPEFIAFVAHPGPIMNASDCASNHSIWKRLTSGVTDVPILSSLERQLATVVTQSSEHPSSNGLISPSSLSPVEHDVHLLRKLQRAWGSNMSTDASSNFSSLSPGLPFHKFCVLMLGSTSAGKSAFANWLFNANIKKSADNQQDTGYTLIEVVEDAFFRQLSHDRVAPRKQTTWSLTDPIVDPETDPRYGEVFFYLSPEQTRLRYEQLSIDITSGVPCIDLFSAVLVNKKWLDPNHPNFELACRTILIDSPGFDSVRLAEVTSKFLINLKIIGILYQLADVALFFLQGGNITTQAASQIPMLELSLLFGTHNSATAESAIVALSGTNDSSATFQPKSILRSIFSREPATDSPSAQFSHTAAWAKSLFLISKIDTVWFNAADKSSALKKVDGERALSAQYYELGLMLSKHLTRLPPPPMDSVLLIGLPGEQRRRDSTFIGDLDLLRRKLHQKSLAVKFTERLEIRLQEMCDLLLRTIQGSWSKYSPSQFLVRNDAQTVEEILLRSKGRLAANISHQ